MQTATTQRAVKARKKAAAPFSAAAAKLIEQVQAEAREQLLCELSAKDAVIILQGFDTASRTVRCDGASLRMRDDKGNSLRLYRYHTPPSSWKDSDWHPAHWSGYQGLVDASGRTWERYIYAHVCDDFGNLVEVAK